MIRQNLPEALGRTGPLLCWCPGGSLRHLMACGPSGASPPHLPGSWGSNHVDIVLLTPSPATQAPRTLGLALSGGVWGVAAAQHKD